ncbi:hypothetical protein HK105_203018 [Polyrhizophydium stewartii]|uniref:Ankyrin repeat protein n=1 Tax=Polyrhizophydium stewartii TaxID=2732419 RepID=A0ABR4NCY2_9FUNG
MSLWSALNLNRSDIIDMIMSHDPRVKTEEFELAIALGCGNYDLARQLIGLEQPRGGRGRGGVVVDMLAQFYGGSKEVLASRSIAAGNLDLLRETTKDSMDSGRLIVMAVSVAAGSGLLEILQYVFEKIGGLFPASDALESAVKGDWHDVVFWLIKGPLKLERSPWLMRGIVHASDLLLEILMQMLPGRETEFVDAAARHGRKERLARMLDRGLVCSTAALDGAAHNKHVECVKLLEIVDLLLRGRISGSVKDVERIIDAQRDPKAIEILQRGVDATECDCGLLFKAIEGSHVEAAKVFVEMCHRVGNKEGEALGKQHQEELVVALQPLLDVRRLEILLSKTARNSGRRGIVKQLLSEKHEEAEDEHQHLRRSKRERVVAKSQQSDKCQRQG